MATDHHTALTLLSLISKSWPKVDLPTTQLVICVARLRDLILADVRPIMARFGLTPIELDVLATMRALPQPHEITPTELYRTVLGTSGGMSKLLNGLEERGLITRMANKKDGRSKRVRLTAKGKRLVEKALATVSQSHSRYLSNGLSDAEMARLVILLKKLLNSLESEEIP